MFDVSLGIRLRIVPGDVQHRWRGPKGLALEQLRQSALKFWLVSGEPLCVPGDETAPGMINAGIGCIGIDQIRHNILGKPHIVEVAEVVFSCLRSQIKPMAFAGS